MNIWPWRNKEIRLTQSAWGARLKDGKCEACGFADDDFEFCPECSAHSRWPVDSVLEWVEGSDPVGDLTPRSEALLCLSAIRDHFTFDDDDKPDAECPECIDRFEVIREFLFSIAPETLAPSPPSVQQNKKESPPVEEGKENG